MGVFLFLSIRPMNCLLPVAAASEPTPAVLGLMLPWTMDKVLNPLPEGWFFLSI